MKIKAILFLFFFIVVSFFVKAQEEEYHHCFLPEKSYSIGGSFAYPAEFGTPGFNIRAYRNINHKFCYGPEVSYFYKNSEENLLDFDFVAHYIFDIKPIEIGFYPVGGFNYAIEKKEGYLEAEVAYGAILGAGLHRNFKRFTLFVEYGHIFSELSENQFLFGFLYTIK